MNSNHLKDINFVHRKNTYEITPIISLINISTCGLH